MRSLLKFKFFLWYFSHVKVAMIGYVRPKLLELNEEKIVLCIPLKRRTRNHLKSMYFGALAVGADLAGGFHGYYHASLANCRISLAFKSFQAQFLRRPEADVYFVCDEGMAVRTMINKAQAQGERLNQPLAINAYINYPHQPELVAQFILELSIKVI